MKNDSLYGIYMFLVKYLVLKLRFREKYKDFIVYRIFINYVFDECLV